MAKNKKIQVSDIDISVSLGDEDYICITDMAKGAGDNKRAADVIKNWVRTRGTIEFLGTWESLYNPDFKVVEFDHFRKEAGLPSFVMTPKQWIEKTNAVGIISKSGRYGGTYAHKDIAFEFGSSISPIFKIFLIKEFQRLKELESNTQNLEWNVKRLLAKANHRIHTDAIKEYVLPVMHVPKDKEWTVYANEVDMVSVALFGYTAKQWKKANPNAALNGMNMRDLATIDELAVLSNLQSFNSELIKIGATQQNRFIKLKQIAESQLRSLSNVHLGKNTLEEANNPKVESNHIREPLTKFNKSLKTALNYNPKEDK